MRTLFESPFFESVRESISTAQIPPPDILAAHFGGFSAALTADMEHEESILSQFRYLRLAHIEICSFHRQMEVCGIKNNSLLVTLLWKALGMVEVELDVVQMKIKQNGLASVPPGSGDGKGNNIPVAYWSKEYTVTDLMELIVALYESGALVYRDGSKVSMAALVRLFEHTFNIRIKDPQGLKSNVTTRKIRAMKFLNVLSGNFIRLCS